MGSDNGHGHQHDTHYHGEPSRVLDDQALPEAVVFYESGLDRQSNREISEIDGCIETWISQLEDQGMVQRAIVGSNRSVSSGDDITVNKLKDNELNPFHEDFEGFAKPLLDEPGVLFIPAQLSLSEGAWSDLKANDVSVNWLSVLPDARDREKLPRVIVLSDWITTIGSDIPDVRSTGVTPGVFYIKQESLRGFEDICRGETSLATSLQALLDREGEKIRPGFLRGRSWSFEDTV
ncbi:MAG: hypothetical protein ABEK50_01200 [bacterium]